MPAPHFANRLKHRRPYGHNCKTKGKGQADTRPKHRCRHCPAFSCPNPPVFRTRSIRFHKPSGRKNFGKRIPGQVGGPEQVPLRAKSCQPQLLFIAFWRKDHFMTAARNLCQVQPCVMEMGMDMGWLARYAKHCDHAPHDHKSVGHSLRAAFGAPVRISCQSCATVN